MPQVTETVRKSGQRSWIGRCWITPSSHNLGLRPPSDSQADHAAGWEGEPSSSSEGDLQVRGDERIKCARWSKAVRARRQARRPDHSLRTASPSSVQARSRTIMFCDVAASRCGLTSSSTGPARPMSMGLAIARESSWFDLDYEATASVPPHRSPQRA
jgi:hypothetical protein